MPSTQYSISAKHYSSGLDLKSGPENLPPEALTVAQNVRFNREGGVFTRKGFDQKADIGTSAKIDTIETTSFHNVMFLKSGTKVEQSVDGATWYDIGLTRTAASRDTIFEFDKNVYVTNDVDAFTRISVTTANGAIGGSDTEINLRAGDGEEFAASGKVYINGDEVDYSGKNADQLTGVTNLASAHATLSIITQTSSITGTAVTGVDPNGKCMAELEGVALVGGVAETPSTIILSAAANSEDPQFFYDFSGNGASFELMSSKVNALHNALGIVVIGMEKGIEYAYAFDVDSGQLLTRNLSKTLGVPNAFCICDAEDVIYVFTGKRIIPIMADENGVRIIDDPENPFDYPVQAFLDGADDDQSLSFCHYDPVLKELSVSIIESGISKELIYNKAIGAWSIDVGKPVACKTNFDGRVWMGSDNDDKVYLDRELTTDDSISIHHRIVTPIYVVDDRRVSSDYLKFTFGGLLSGAGEFVFRVFVNGVQVGADEIITASSLIDSGLMSTATGTPIGGGNIGGEVIGSGGSETEAFRFTFPYEMLESGEQIQFEFEILDEGTQFELRDSRLDAETVNFLYLPKQ